MHVANSYFDHPRRLGQIDAFGVEEVAKQLDSILIQ
jgi:hypothetical protein